jgi:uncharacterized membrane protein
MSKKKRRKRRPRRPAPPQPAKAAPVRPRRRGDDERPPAPWGSFPLVEIAVFVALVILVVGFFTAGSRGALLIGTGLALGSLAGLELSIREHFAGYRSHTALLAGAASVATLVLLAVSGLLDQAASLAVAVAVFVAAVWALTRAFRRRSGRSFKLR